jgi:hypothetical protein
MNKLYYVCIGCTVITLLLLLYATITFFIEIYKLRKFRGPLAFPLIGNCYNLEAMKLGNITRKYLMFDKKDIKNMYDENIVFRYSSISDDKHYPGFGDGEKIPEKKKSLLLPKAIVLAFPPCLWVYISIPSLEYLENKKV